LVTDIFTKALSTELLQKDIEQLVPLYLSRSTFEKHLLEAETESDPDGFSRLTQLLEDGIQLVRQASPTGDPALRLEKYLSKLYRAAGLPSKSSQVWKSATEFYKSSYTAWLAYTDALIDDEEFSQVREVFQNPQLKFVDWPEAIWEAWLLFENLHGSVQELETAIDKIEKFRGAVNAKRAREAYQAMQQAAEEQLKEPIQDVQALQTQQAQAQATDIQMDVDHAAVVAPASTKRKSEDQPSTSSKKAKTDTTEPPKRDRENSTVFVGNLPTNPTKESLSSLFEDCGAIREIKISVVQRRHVATIEFADRDCVPAALTKDKKRIDDQEIEVHLAWKSTLYVTNFPEKADDEEIRSIFGQVKLYCPQPTNLLGSRVS
jgi:hypothetical protein